MPRAGNLAIIAAVDGHLQNRTEEGGIHALGQFMSTTPEAIVNSLDRQAERLETPCGEGSMVWRRWGTGARRVVLLHGGHGAWSHWIRNIPVLAQRYTVLAADAPGCGESASPPMPFDGDSLADIVVAGLNEIIPADALPYHLVGFSFGGVLSGPVAYRLGQRLASQTLVGAGGLGLVPRIPRENFKSWRKLTDPAEIMAAHRFNLGVLMISDPTRIDDLAAYIQNRNTRNSRLDSPSVGRTGILRRVLPQTKVPLNGIWGEFDVVVKGQMEACREILLDGHPELDFRYIPDAGHWVQYEAAGRFNAMLLDMLAAREA